MAEQQKDTGLPEGFVPLDGTSNAAANLPEGFVSSDPSFEQKAEALGQGILKGGVRGTGSLAGAYTGAKGAAALGTAFPVLGPATPLVFGTIGSIIGLIAGGTLADELTDDVFPGVAREDLLPYYAGGETFAETLAFSPAAYMLPKNQATKFGRYLSAMRGSAEKYPLLYGVSQVTGGAGAGVGGGIAVELDPNNPWSRFGGEVVGGYLAPGKMFANLTSNAIEFGRSVTSNISESSRNARAGQVLRAYLIEAGDDPNEVIRLLSKPIAIDVAGKPINVTAGQKTGLESLNTLEATLAARHPKYSGETTAQGQAALQAHKLLIARMREVGTPEFLQKAAELEAQYFDNQIQSRLDLALAEAASAAAKISNDTPAVRQQLGLVIQDNVRDALKEARAVESKLWNDAYRNSLVKRKEKLDYADAEVPDRQDPNFTIYMKGNNDTVIEVTYDPNKTVMQGVGDFIAKKYGMPWPKWTKDPDALREFQELERRYPYGVVDQGKSRTVETVLPASRMVVAPKEVPINNFTKTFLDFTSSITPERFKYDLPPALRDLASRLLGGENKVETAINRYKMGKNTPEFFDENMVPSEFLPTGIKDVPVDELIRIRGDLLNYAREAAGKGEISNASLYGRLAESVLDDMSKKLKSVDYNRARAYSKALNDTFTRSFAGDITSKDVSGAERLPAEILVTRAFGRNADVTAMRMDQIESSVDFIRQQYEDAVREFGPRSKLALLLKPLVPDSKKGVASIRDAQARVLRLAAFQTVGPDGRVNPARLERFVSENNEALRKYGVLGDLEDAVRAENAFRLTTEQTAVVRGMRDQQAFAQLLKYGDPTKAVTDALRGRFPLKSFQGLVGLARAGGPGAVDGLKSTLYDYAFTAATNKNGNFSPAVFEEVFFKPLGNNQPSIYQIMRAQGLMSLSEGKNLKRIVEPMRRIEENLRRGNVEDMIVPGTSPVTDLALRVIGANIGTKVAPGGPGSLIAASAGSKAVRSVFDKMPMLSLTRTIEQATRDPELMRLLLQKAPIPRQQFQIQKMLNAHLVAAGLNLATPDEELVPEEVLVTPTTGPTASQMLRQMPPAPPTRGVPGMPTGAPPTAQGPGGAGGPSGQSRAMLQSLFPFDTTLSAGLPRP